MKLLGVLLLGAPLLSGMSAGPAGAQTWGHAHGGQDNAGFADVATAPATPNAMQVIASQLGPFAPGVGPVVAKTGEIYLATADAKLIALNPDGTVKWTAQLPSFRHIFASPMVSLDGSIYVASSSGLGRNVHDHRTATWLTKYRAVGTRAWEKPLPIDGNTSGTALAVNSFGTNAGTEVIIVGQIAFPKADQPISSITGFDRNGNQVFHQLVSDGSEGPPTHADSESTLSCVIDVSCWFGLHHISTAASPPQSADSRLPADKRLPDEVHGAALGIAIANDTIVVADGLRGIRGFRLANGGLIRTFEKLDDHFLTTAPAALPDLHSVYAVYPGRIAFAGPNDEKIADIFHGQDHHELPVEASPTRLGNGRVVTVDRDGRVTVIDHVTPTSHASTQAQSIAPASASRNFYYVSTRTGLVTFDATTNQQVAAAQWNDGGQSSPAIGDDGSVYALAGGKLVVIPVSSLRPGVRDHRTEPPPPAHPQPAHPQPARPPTGTPRDHRTVPG